MSCLSRAMLSSVETCCYYVVFVAMLCCRVMVCSVTLRYDMICSVKVCCVMLGYVMLCCVLSFSVLSCSAMVRYVTLFYALVCHDIVLSCSVMFCHARVLF